MRRPFFMKERFWRWWAARGRLMAGEDVSCLCDRVKML